jgi:aryl-alcohol dehydrogenase-like predicted oxidoreductase
VLEACRENGVTLVAYSPICQGILSGKYTPDGPKPTGPRAAIYASKIREVQALVDVMRAVGAEHGGKTPTQVALNWLVCKGALPIPGAKNAKQVRVLRRGGGLHGAPGPFACLPFSAPKSAPPPPS